MLGISTYEFLIIVVVAVLVLGPEHLPKVIRTMTRVMSDFRRISTEFQRAVNLEFPEPAPRRNAARPKASAPAAKDAAEPFQDGSAPELSLAAADGPAAVPEARAVEEASSGPAAGQPSGPEPSSPPLQGDRP
jgi:sec-independent protein translocase protein TatB